MADMVTCRVADYSDAADAATVSTLLNGYALDQFGNSAPLDLSLIHI